MTTSGEAIQELTGRDIEKTALELLGAVSGIPSATQAAQAKTFLNMMLKVWAGDSRLWLKTEGTLTLVAAQASYVLPVDVKKVLSVRRRTNSIDTPMTQLAREKYFDFPTKASAGMPVNWYADDQRAARTLYIWSVPTAAIVANTTLKYTYARDIEIYSEDSTGDLPDEWQEALVYNLAAKLLPIYPQEGATAALIRQSAKDSLDALISQDQEATSLFLQPASQFSR